VSSSGKLTTAGIVSSGNGFFTGTSSVTPPSGFALGVGTTTSGPNGTAAEPFVQAFSNASVGTTTGLQFQPSGGAVFTHNSILDDGSGNSVIAGCLQSRAGGFFSGLVGTVTPSIIGAGVNLGSVSSGSGAIQALTSSGAVNNLQLQPDGGGVFSFNNTLDNGGSMTAAGSITQTLSSGAVNIGGVINQTNSGRTSVITGPLSAGSINASSLSSTGTVTVGGTAVLTAGAGTAFTLPATNGTLALTTGIPAGVPTLSGNNTFTGTNAFGAVTSSSIVNSGTMSSGATTLSGALTSGTNSITGGAISGSTVSSSGTVTVGGTAVLTAGAGTAFTLPATSGTLALTTNIPAGVPTLSGNNTFTGTNAFGAVTSSSIVNSGTMSSGATTLSGALTSGTNSITGGAISGSTVSSSGTVTVGGTAVLTAGAGTAIQLPAISGTLALTSQLPSASNFWIGSSTSVTGSSFILSQIAASGISVSSATLTIPAGNYMWYVNDVTTISASTTGTISVLIVTGGGTIVVSPSGTNNQILEQNNTLTSITQSIVGTFLLSITAACTCALQFTGLTGTPNLSLYIRQIP
jgi:hypothetical protein